MGSSEQPGEATAPAVRASDAERERTATLLREHYGAGRLSSEELSERLDAAFAARTVAELEALAADLPALAGGAPARRPKPSPNRTRVVHAVGSAVLVNVAAVAVWLAVGAEGSFWPKWVLLLTAIRLAFVAWGELGPAAGQDEARLGRGGSGPRAPEPDRRTPGRR